MFTLQITNPATGAYTFTLLDQLDHGLGANDNDEALLAINFSSVLVATDADGDFIPLTGAFTISVENDIPVQVGTPVTGTVYEDLLAGGNPDTPANPAGASTIATGTLAGLVSFGADQPGTITLSPTTSGLPQNLTSIGAPVVYNVTGNLLTAFVDTGPAGLDAGDRQVFTLQITNPATGAYTFTLLDQLDHGLGANDNDEALLAINLSSVLVATDADGDFIPLTGAFTISVENDIPVQTAGTVTQTVYEDLLAGGNPDTPANPAGASTVATGTLAGLVSFGADQPGTITLSPTTSGLPQNLTSIGAPVVYNVTGNLLTAFVDSGHGGLRCGRPPGVHAADHQPGDGRLHVHAAGPARPRSGRERQRRGAAGDQPVVDPCCDRRGRRLRPADRRLHHQCRERHPGPGWDPGDGDGL